MTQNHTSDSSASNNLQKLYQDFVETSQELFWRCDYEGRYTYLNPVWKVKFGYTVEEMLGKKFIDFMSPETAQRDMKTFKHLLNGGTTIAYETTHLTKTGNDIHLLFNANPLIDHTGKITGTYGTAFDVTKRKQTEEALRKSEERFRLLAENSKDMIYRMSLPDGFYEYVSPSSVNVFGYTPEQFISSPLLIKNAIHPDWRDYFNEQWKKLLDGNMPPTYEYQIVHGKTKETRWLHQRNVLIYNDEGQPVAIEGIVTDITERKLTEEALEKRIIALTRPLSQDMPVAFEELFDLTTIQRLQDEFAAATGVASIITSPDGTPITRPSNFTYLCSEIIRKTEKGCSNCFRSDAILGAPNPEGPTVQPCFSGGLWDAGASISIGGYHIANWLIGQVRDETQTEEAMLAYADEIGADRTVFIKAFRKVPSMSSQQFKRVSQMLFTMANQLSTTAYQNMQQARFLVESKQAESLRLQYEQQLQINQRLESLGILAGGIAHDFNNLMGGIFGYIEIASEESMQDEVTAYLSKAMTTINRARALTSQLITFAKGGDPIRNVARLFPFIEETARFALSGSNVSCNFDVPQGLWLCNFDKNQIGQVIDNLIINAQQAMPVGGTIQVSARNITLAEKEHASLKKDNYIKISVQDCGIGIQKEFVSRIFDPFFTTKEKGHGLGLATCYSIVNKHDGCIDVESEISKGTTFHVYLPAATNSVLSSKNKPVTIHKGCGTFLIMDDEEVMRDTIRNMLTSLGYTAVCKENGTDAIEFFASEISAQRKIAGMIFDLTVPGDMGGKEAIEEIRKLNIDVPAFVASGYAEDPVMKNPSAYGFTASICKPFRKVELSDMLNTYLKQK